MAFSSIFKKATNLLGLGTSDSLRPPPLDGEIIYCKNNVCVHPPASLLLDTEHHPGYLTLRAHQNQLSRPTLVLTWIPNTTLRKNPHSIESSPIKSHSSTPKISPRRNPKQEFAKSDDSMTLTPSPSPSSAQDSLYHEDLRCKQLSNDSNSIGSEASYSSVSVDDSNISEEASKDIERRSSNCRSQADSGLGADEVNNYWKNLDQQLQNNEKNVACAWKPARVGLRVNDLNCEKGFRSDFKNLSGQKDPGPKSDDFTSEEQLAAMLNRNKLHLKTKDKTDGPSKPVSIEIKGDNLVVVTEPCPVIKSDPNINRDENKFETSSSQSTDVDNASLSSNSTNQSPSSFQTQPAVEGGINNCDGLPAPKRNSRELLTLDLLHMTGPPPNSPAITPDISITKSKSRSSSSSSTTTSGPDSKPPTPPSSEGEGESVLTSPHRSSVDECPESPSSNGSTTGYAHNMMFPESAMTLSTSSISNKEKKSAKEQVCGVFSVDLGQMRSLRLFYNDAACTQGQVVIASRESQYKILHFHNGGLDKLAEIFEEWSLFAQEVDEVEEGDKPYRQFLVVKPQLSDDQCHPEEYVFSMVNDEIWQEHMMPDGSFENIFQLRKVIFFGGIDPSHRPEIWPFLLHYYPFSSTFEEREHIRNDKFIEYQNIRKVRESMGPAAQQHFWRTIQCIVEKDVVRTDRSHPYFRGENNPNIEVLKNVLLNYAVANPSMGYTQGMSDILAPVLAAIQQESEAYWCFAGLMTKTIFVSSPTDSDMDQQLDYLRELFRVTLPKFHYHLKLLGQDALELLFCHRWILLCFKREFCEEDALRIWEACWARYQTDYFHLFLCVAIVAIYGDDVVDQRLPADEILLHFSSLAMHMNGHLVLKKARGLLHEFRKRLKIPCTLYGLCSQVNAGMWDSGHAPTVECIGHLGDQLCSYNSNPSTPSYNGD